MPQNPKTYRKKATLSSPSQQETEVIEGGKSLDPTPQGRYPRHANEKKRMEKRGRPRISMPNLILVAANYETGAYDAPGRIGLERAG